MAVCITIYDIAEQAQVSIATVSRVFNDHPRVSPATRQRVLEVAETLGYQPNASAQSLARRRTNLICAVIPMMTNYFFVEVLRGLQDRLAESEFDLMVYSARTLEEVDDQLERALHRGKAAGVMLFSTPLTSVRVTSLQQSEQPLVLVDSFHPDFDSVSIDNKQGGYLATRHLIDQGFERIGLLMANPASVPASERRMGYERALCEAGMPILPELIEQSDDLDDHGYTETAGYEHMQRLLEAHRRPKAVFVTSDIQALGALRAVREVGLHTPDDIALIGFDDIMVSRYIGLSTLRQPMYEMGKLAVDKLLMRIDAPNHPTAHTVFSPRLVARQTTASRRPHRILPQEEMN